MTEPTRCAICDAPVATVRGGPPRRGTRAFCAPCRASGAADKLRRREFEERRRAREAAS